MIIQLEQQFIRTLEESRLGLQFQSGNERHRIDGIMKSREALSLSVSDLVVTWS
jgi:hypothetical protein